MKLIIILVFFFVIQSMGDRDDGKNARAIEDPCEKLAQEYNQLKQNLFAYKRDFFITICFIINFSVLGIMCYFKNRRNGSDPRWPINPSLNFNFIFL